MEKKSGGDEGGGWRWGRVSVWVGVWQDGMVVEVSDEGEWRWGSVS